MIERALGAMIGDRRPSPHRDDFATALRNAERFVPARRRVS